MDRIVVTFVSLVLAFSMSAAQALVGLTPGELGVSDQGAATYSIPITVPPGTAAMQPSISLNYTSQSGNGALGVGWSLGGLSVINRCPQTKAQDGQIRGVDFTVSDRFCLDSQRLNVVNGLPYGSHGAEYRTEIESFSKIISYGNAGGGPQRFKVWKKSGEILEYGFTPDSRIEAAGRNQAAVWAVNKVSDSVGNYFSVTYHEDPVSGHYRVTRIDYTGNSNAALVPNASVRFEYQGRPDKVLAYVGGSKLTIPVRMSRVVTYVGESIVRSYRLKYQLGVSSGRSRLVSITECSGAGSCKPATTFDWQSGKKTISLSNYSNGLADTYFSGGGTDMGTRLADINGDGLSDLVQLFLPTTKWYGKQPQRRVLLNTGTRFAYDSSYSNSLGDTYFSGGGTDMGTRLADINGDGLSDLVQLFLPTNSWYGGKPQRRVYLNNGTRFAYNSNYSNSLADTYFSGGGTDMGTRLADINGDGLSDLVQLFLPTSNNWYGGQPQRRVYLNNGTRFAYDNSYSNSLGDTYFSGGGTDMGTRLADVNGDGLSDLVQLFLPTNGWYGGQPQRRVYLNNGTRFAYNSSFSNSLADSYFSGGGTDMGTRLADINGDGQSDLVQLFLPTNSWYGGQPQRRVFLSTGTRFSRNAAYSNSLSDSYFTGGGTDMGTRLVDMNGDGLNDLVQLFLPTNSWYSGQAQRRVFLNAGTRFTFDSTYSNSLRDTYFSGGGTDMGTRLADVSGDGLTDLVQLFLPTNTWYSRAPQRRVFEHNGNRPDLLTKVTNGLGATTVIQYAPITDDLGYTKGNLANYPELDFQGPFNVVARVTNDDGRGGLRRTDYSYGGAKINLHGRGFLGFAWIEGEDQRAGVITTTEYRQDFPFTGRVASTTQSLRDGTLLSHTDQSWTSQTLNGGLSHFPRLVKRSVEEYEPNQGPNNLPVLITTTANTYDAWGNITNAVVTTAGGGETVVKRTLSTYTNNTVKWRLGQVSRRQVIDQRNATTISRVSTFAYKPGNGLLTRETIEPNTALELVKAYQYDAYGNRTRVTTSGADISARATNTSYDHNLLSKRGQFPTLVKNAMGHQETRSYDSRFGVVTQLTGPNGLSTRWDYDALGRKIAEYRADGTETHIDYFWCNATTACPAHAMHPPVYKVVTRDSGKPIRIAYYDQFQREVRTETRGLHDRVIYQDSEYDIYGRLSRKSRAYFAGEAPLWAAYAYDIKDRLKRVTAADGSITRNAYNGFITRATDAEGKITTKVRDLLGGTARVTDHLNNTVNYRYDATGNLLETEDAAGNIIYLTYDVRGRKLSMDDPDMGFWEYDYNVLGELIWQRDGNGQITELFYDALGRKTSRLSPEGTTLWTYDMGAQAIGKLSEVSAPGGFRKTHSYDAYGRPAGITEYIDTLGYTMTTSYDSAGRVATVGYPQANGNFRLRRSYDANGHLSAVVNDLTNKSYWEANSADAQGHIIRARLGNGLLAERFYEVDTGRLAAISTAGGAVQDLEYFYDRVGNLIERQDWRQGGLNERFTYDALHRLESSTLVGLGSKSYAYDALGNLTLKSDIGSGSYMYGGAGAGPHAVTHAAGNSYTYDANGNMLSGAGRTLEWTSFNQPARISSGTNVINLAYDADEQRIKKQSNSATTHYVGGGSYEKIISSGGREVHRYYVRAGDEVIARVERSKIPGGWIAEQTRYLHRDHLGSVDTITNEQGQVAERLSFDAFGQRRTASWQDGFVTTDFTQGFTGHEHDDEMGLIHMRGRLYDPVLGRFLSADPYVQTQDNPQALNRYSYVNNNPLSYTDPSGFFLKKLFKSVKKFVKKYWKPIVAAVAAYFTYGLVSNAYFWSNAAAGTFSSISSLTVSSAIVGGAASGFVAGAILTGSLKGAVIGAVSGAAFGGISGYYGNTWTLGRVAANSLAGGASAELAGGRFKEGFKLSMAVSLLTYGNYQMRQVMLRNASLNPDNIDGDSAGFFGDGKKLAGARRTIDPNTGAYTQCTSLMGGCQGQQILAGDDRSSFLGMPYDPGSLPDFVNESFAGPHDWLRNATGSYNALGNSHYFTGIRSIVDSVANYGLVMPASPFAVAGMVSPSLYPNLSLYDAYE